VGEGEKEAKASIAFENTGAGSEPPFFKMLKWRRAIVANRRL